MSQPRTVRNTIWCAMTTYPVEATDRLVVAGWLPGPASTQWLFVGSGEKEVRGTHLLSMPVSSLRRAV